MRTAFVASTIVPTNSRVEWEFSLFTASLSAATAIAPAPRMSRVALFIAWLLSLFLVIIHAYSSSLASSSAVSKPPSLSCSLCRRILRDISRDVARTSPRRLAETVVEKDEPTGDEREIPYEVRFVWFHSRKCVD